MFNKLSHWLLSSNGRLFNLHIMPRRVILCRHGPYGSDRSVCTGLLLGRVFNCLFELFIGIIFFICLFNGLLELSRGLLSGLDGIHFVYGLPRRIILRDNGSHSCDGKLCFGVLL
jgi:hypothetical protein